MSSCPPPARRPALCAAFACATLLCVVSHPARAGAWARDAGGAYARLGGALFLGDPAFLLPVGGGSFRTVAAEVYLEAGLGAGLELDVSFALVDHRNVRAGDALHSTGPGDVEALVKWAPVNGSTAVALTLGTRLAAYRRVPDDELAAGTPHRGPGGADILVGASWGHSLYPRPTWVAVDLLHRVRLGGASSGQLVRGEVGGALAGTVRGAAVLEVQPAFGRDTDRADDAPAPVPLRLSVGVKGFAPLAAGFSLQPEAAWLPPILNDGPGVRVAVSVTWEVTPGDSR